MIRLYLTVEGQTEAEFAHTVLKPHLANFDVHLAGVRFTGLGRRKPGSIPKGGLLNRFSPTLKDIQLWLSEDQNADARFTMMVDLYSLPDDFPGYEAARKKPAGTDQAKHMEQELAQTINDYRFIPYLQVYEFEALILADPEVIEVLYAAKTEGLQKECAEFTTPEEINHGQHSHPKYRIKKYIPTYDENIAGPLLAEKIGLHILRQRCPHFGEWLTKLEQLNPSFA